TIVELIDLHQGFDVVTSRIATRSKRSLLWIVALATFFLSPVLDNLTTAIVMISVARKFISETKERWIFGGMIVIASNAGGAWSPIGDVTTTMLWIGGQISPLKIMSTLFLPSLVCLLVPLVLLTFSVRGRTAERRAVKSRSTGITSFDKHFVFLLGMLGLISVPVFKSLTGLPPYLGILLALGVIWAATEILHRGKKHENRNLAGMPERAAGDQPSVESALSRIDIPSILFFLGILAAVGALESAGLLKALASTLDRQIGNQSAVVFCLGILSAVIDNVPLVAAGMGMYDLKLYPRDSLTWEFLAYTAGTGGSMLIIGSAAGVAVMGLEKIPFFWYLKKISGPALAGFAAGAAFYLLTY
ncbi:MAG: sodium:proton antiporter NhaD, partial [Spirochaetia bacterium]|nr:sodium:proton antiporter NhaD [Spirochaetia bacterium]